MTRDELVALARRFTDAFNRDDLDGVMALFAEDAVYDEFHGARHAGREAIRAAFAPQFRGDFGRLRFHEEGVFADAATRQAMISWTCAFETPERSGGWRGLDVLAFDETGRVRHKSTYAKTRAPLVAPGNATRA